mgnify:CR=1 FL=1
MKKYINENIDNEEMVFQHGSTPHKEIADFQPKIKPLIAAFSVMINLLLFKIS